MFQLNKDDEESISCNLIYSFLLEETSTTKDKSDICSHHVLARYKHPLYPEVDLALLHLDHPYMNTMENLNYTRNDNFLEK